MRIALLGMGRMGQALGGRILDSGHDVVIWNRTPGKAPELVARGAREAETIALAASGAAVVITSLANDDAVRDVAVGPEGVRAALESGAVYLDASTISPTLSAELEEALPRFAAMPVLGSPAAVASGQATYLLGGAAGATAAVDPLLPDLTSTVRRYGSAPLASTAKLAVNLLLLDTVVALAESFAVGRSGGLSDDELRELLAGSPILPPGLKNRFEGVLTGHQDPWWSAALGGKDAGLAVDVARRAAQPLPLTEAARDQYRQAVEQGFGNDDITAVTKLYRR